MDKRILKRLQGVLARREGQVQDERGRFAILALLCEREGELHVLFESRAETLRGQPGETCFPGGRIEAGETALCAALRETFEEIGIPAEDIVPLGPLDLIVDISNRVIFPFLGYVTEEGLAKLLPNTDEVKEVFFIPLRHLCEQKPYVYVAPVQVQVGEDFPYEKIGMGEDYRWRGGVVDVPVYEYAGKTVWGLTARALRTLLLRLKEAGL